MGSVCFGCFITGICVFFFWLTTYYRYDNNLVLLKSTTKQLKSLNSSCLSSEQGHAYQSVLGDGESLKSPDIHDQYPRDTVKPAGLKNDVNRTRSAERNKNKKGTQKAIIALINHATHFISLA